MGLFSRGNKNNNPTQSEKKSLFGGKTFRPESVEDYRNYSERQLFAQFKSENWNVKEPDDKIAILQEIENREAELHNRPAAKVVQCHSDKLGGYTGATHVIEVTLTDNPFEDLDSLFHESEHANQVRASIDTVGFTSDDKKLMQIENMTSFDGKTGHYWKYDSLYAVMTSELDANNAAVEKLVSLCSDFIDDDNFQQYLITRQDYYDGLSDAIDIRAEEKKAALLTTIESAYIRNELTETEYNQLQDIINREIDYDLCEKHTKEINEILAHANMREKSSIEALSLKMESSEGNIELAQGQEIQLEKTYPSELQALIIERDRSKEALQQMKTELRQVSIDVERKRDAVSIEEYGTESYRQAALAYSASRDKLTELQGQIAQMEDRQIDLSNRVVEVRNVQLKNGETARVSSENSLFLSKDLQRKFDETFYGKAKSSDLRNIQDENSKLISKMSSERNDIKVAMEAKMSEIRDYVFEHNFERYDTERNPYYQSLVSEYRSLDSRYHNLDYNIAKLDENNLQIAETIGSEYQSIRYRTDENTNGANSGADIPVKTKNFIEEIRTNTQNNSGIGEVAQDLVSKQQLFDRYQVIDANQIQSINNSADNFWSHHGNTKEDYMRLASKLPEIQQEFAEGKTYDQIKANPELYDTLVAYYSHDKMIRVMQDENGNYQFEDDGRHRITAAQELGYQVPVNVVNSEQPEVVNYYENLNQSTQEDASVAEEDIAAAKEVTEEEIEEAVEEATEVEDEETQEEVEEVAEEAAESEEEITEEEIEEAVEEATEAEAEKTQEEVEEAAEEAAESEEEITEEEIEEAVEEATEAEDEETQEDVEVEEAETEEVETEEVEVEDGEVEETETEEVEIEEVETEDGEVEETENEEVETEEVETEDVEVEETETEEVETEEVETEDVEVEETETEEVETEEVKAEEVEVEETETEEVETEEVEAEDIEVEESETEEVETEEVEAEEVEVEESETEELETEEVETEDIEVEESETEEVDTEEVETEEVEVEEAETEELETEEVEAEDIEVEESETEELETEEVEAEEVEVEESETEELETEEVETEDIEVEESETEEVDTEEVETEEVEVEESETEELETEEVEAEEVEVEETETEEVETEGLETEEFESEDMDSAMLDDVEYEDSGYEEDSVMVEDLDNTEEVTDLENNSEMIDDLDETESVDSSMSESYDYSSSSDGMSSDSGGMDSGGGMDME